MEEIGWVIERHINSELRYWDGRSFGDESFVSDSLKAIRFARSEDAQVVLAWGLKGLGRVGQHMWTDMRGDDPTSVAAS